MTRKYMKLGKYAPSAISSKFSYWLVSILLVAYSPVQATEVIRQPSGFWLMPSNHSMHLYGPTRPDANWNVAQWDIQQDLPPFLNGKTSNEFASVEVDHEGSYRLTQTPNRTPCERRFPSGKRLVNEFDLFVAPNSAETLDAPHAPSFNQNLADMHSLDLSLDVDLIDAHIIDDKCGITQAAIIMAIVLTNKQKRETFFYQLRLGVLKLDHDLLRNVQQQPNWFSKGGNVQTGKKGQFGLGDNISNFSQSSLTVGKSISLNIDLLPRLRAVLSEGKSFGMDQNLHDWFVTGTYHGTNAFGHMVVSTRWQNFRLTATD